MIFHHCNILPSRSVSQENIFARALTASTFIIKRFLFILFQKNIKLRWEKIYGIFFTHFLHNKLFWMQKTFSVLWPRIDGRQLFATDFNSIDRYEHEHKLCTKLSALTTFFLTVQLTTQWCYFCRRTHVPALQFNKNRVSCNMFVLFWHGDRRTSKRTSKRQLVFILPQTIPKVFPLRFNSKLNLDRIVGFIGQMENFKGRFCEVDM